LINVRDRHAYNDRPAWLRRNREFRREFDGVLSDVRATGCDWFDQAGVDALRAELARGADWHFHALAQVYTTVVWHGQFLRDAPPGRDLAPLGRYEHDPRHLQARLIYTLAAVTGKMISFFLLPFYAHVLQDVGYGVIVIEASLHLLFTLMSFGVQSAVTRFYYDRPRAAPPCRQHGMLQTAAIARRCACACWPAAP
jgi:hypothetical protein